MEATPITINPLYVSDARDAHWQKGQPGRCRQRSGRACGLAFKAFCVALIIAALVVWSIYTSRAAGTIIQLLASFDMGKLAQQRLEAALKLLQVSLLAVTCALVGLLTLVAVVKAVQENKRSAMQEPLPHGKRQTAALVTYRGAMVVLLMLLWVLLAGLALLAMLYFTVAVAGFGGAAAATATRTAIQRVAAGVNTTLDSAEDVVASIADTFITESKKTPKPVANTGWYKEMQQKMGPRLQAASVINGTGALACPSNCLDIHVLSVLLDDPTFQPCICGQDKLGRIATMLGSAWRQAATAWGALLALMATCSWLLMMGVAGYARAGCKLAAIHANHPHSRPGASPYDAPALAAGGWLTSRLQTPDSPAGSAAARQGSSKAGFVATSEFPAMDGGSYNGKQDKSAGGAGRHATGADAVDGPRRLVDQGTPLIAPQLPPSEGHEEDVAQPNGGSGRARRRWNV